MSTSLQHSEEICGDIPVSLVVASYNSANLLKKSLESNIDAGFSKIIIVDGHSADGTKQFVNEVSMRHPGRIEFHLQARQGLAAARNYGTLLVDTEHVLHAGPDNIIPSATLREMQRLLLSGYDLVSCGTKLYEPEAWVERVQDVYKKRYPVGLVGVVGTPYVARRDLLKDNPFDVSMHNSDDTDLCDRLVRAGYLIYRSELSCFEVGSSSLGTVVERWMRWGRGDALYYLARSRGWTGVRKMQSLLHPIEAEVLDVFRALKRHEFVRIFPFLLLLVFLRYAGWTRYVILRR